MYYYKAKIQYDGTGYAGFQSQKNIATIQNDFNLALKKIIDGKITTVGASRTDTGVHALDQIVKITSENFINSNLDINLINETLPSQIRCLKIEPCKGEFKPITQSTCKQYCYYFTNKQIISAGDQKYIVNCYYNLDPQLMHHCIQMLIGTHDFKNFYSAGSNVKSTIRKILLCDLNIVNPQDIFANSELFQIPSDIIECYQFKIVGNGFLKQMVRHLVRAIWEVGRGRITLDDFDKLLNGPKIQKNLWKVAPANGLFLFKINF